MLRQALIRLSQQPHLRDIAMHNGLAQKMASRFVAGETLPEAIEVARALRARGMGTTLDHLGENVSTQEEAEAAAEEYCRSLAAMAAARIDLNISLKLTALGMDMGVECAARNLHTVLAQAETVGAFVRIDMESSEYIDRTLEVFYSAFEQHKNVGVVIQSYLYRSERDLERLIEVGARVRLVKGAYLEPPDVAFEHKEDVDANFIRLMQMLLSRGNFPAIATHDIVMIQATQRFAQMNAISTDRFEFQMLYGVRRDLQSQLVADGYGMRVYVPYGTQWYPYLMRRMAERPANVMFVLGNIAREVGARR